MKTINFYKLTAAGNDFVLIDNRTEIVPLSEQPKLALKLCDRRYAIGGDGLILLEKSQKADFKMRYYNSDGSHASMCGNGGRSIARFAYELSIVGKNMTFETDAGLITAEIKSESVVNLALYDPKDLMLDIKLEADGKQFEVSCLNTGVPHAVIFVDDVEQIDVVKYGRLIRYHDKFAPAGTNVNFVQISKDNTILVRTYERGVEDETLACGTGVTASSIISAIKKKVSLPVKIITRGKDNLTVTCSFENSKISNVFLEGPAIVAFKGSVSV